jgi:hypothetical protein
MVGVWKAIPLGWMCDAFRLHVPPLRLHWLDLRNEQHRESDNLLDRTLRRLSLSSFLRVLSDQEARL